ncbi:hypothetical protein P7C70_g2656, partial [Phenoliferia sp. Uapishka_3]
MEDATRFAQTETYNYTQQDTLPPRSSSLSTTPVGATANRRHSASVHGFASDDEFGRARAPADIPRLPSEDRPVALKPSSAIPNLPNLKPGSMDPTALANWDVSQELEFTISKVLGEDCFADLMKDSVAQRRFRDYVAGHSESNPLLIDFYNDIAAFSEVAAKLRAAAQSIEDVYLLKNSPNRLALPINIRGPILDTFRSCRSAGLSIAQPEKDLLAALFNTDFQSYMQAKLVEHAVSRLGSWKVSSGSGDGLADCYCLTNPRLRDHPIVLASEGFAKLTGYPTEAIVGRNCRFLQGPGTAPASVRRLRNALNEGRGITSLLLNYRRNGDPFFNLLCMLPLKDTTGAVKYFLGGQIDVTGNLAAILGSSSGSTDDSNSSIRRKTRSHHHFSEAVRARSEEIKSGSKDSSASSRNLDPSSALRHHASQSTIASERSSQHTHPRPLSPMTNKGPRGTRARKASRGNELGLTVEEHAAINSTESSDPFMNKLSEFEATYSRVILIEKASHTVLFATPELTAFCGMLESSGSELIGLDFLKLICGATKEDSRRLRRNISLALDQGHSYSVAVGLRIKLQKNILLRRKGDETEMKQCYLHLTPLSDREGAVEAFVAVFGGH